MKSGTPHYGRGGSRATEFCIRWQQKPVYRPWATLLFSKKHRSSRCRSSTLKNCEAKTMALRDSIHTFIRERKQKTNDEWFQLTLIFTTTLLDVTAAAAIAADGNSTLSTNEVGAVFDLHLVLAGFVDDVLHRCRHSGIVRKRREKRTAVGWGCSSGAVFVAA